MAVALDTSSAWGLDNGTGAAGTAQTPTTGAFSPAASSILICVVNWASFYDGNVTIATPTNTGTSLTWNLGNNQYFLDSGDPSGYRSKVFWAYNTSSQSNITVSSSCFSTGYAGGAIKVYSFTGHDTSSQLDSSNVAGHTGLVSSVAGGMLVATEFANTSTDLTYSQSGNGIITSVAGYKVLGAAGTYGFNFNYFFGSEAGIIIKAAAGGTAHTASATATGTATGTGTMRNARVGAGSGTGTATGTGAASNQRALDGSATAAATGTGAASRGQSVIGSASVTASATAGMSSTQVIGGSATGTATGTSNGSTTGIVTISVTGTGTASGTAGIEQVTNLYRSGNVYRNVSLYPASIDLITAGGAGSGTATGTGGIEKITNPYRSGNVYRNAGTYPGGAPLIRCGTSTIVAQGSAEMTKTRWLDGDGTALATSSAGMTHTFYVFKPPTREISPVSLDPYFQLVGYNLGKTLVRRDGVWSLVQNKKQEYLDQSEYAFPGGRENRIDGTEKTALESAGYTVETRTS